MLGSNQRPLRCERSALPLSQSPWCPQTTRLLTAGTFAGPHRLAYPGRRGAAGRVRFPAVRHGRAGPIGRWAGIFAGRRRGEEPRGRVAVPGATPGRAPRAAEDGRRLPPEVRRRPSAAWTDAGEAYLFPGDPGRSVRSRITAVTPLPGHRPETPAGRGQALVPLNTNNRHAGIKSRNVVIADEAAGKSRHRVVRPTRKAVCCRIGQSTTVRYLNANRRCARDAKRKLFGPKAAES